MEKILNEILAKLNKMEKNQSKMEENQNKMQQIQIQMQSDISEIKEKVIAVYNQTADLTEFRTETKDNFNNVSKDVKFIKHKLHETEEEMFDIKDRLQIIK